jgi:hypothetical protein
MRKKQKNNTQQAKERDEKKEISKSQTPDVDGRCVETYVQYIHIAFMLYSIKGITCI